MPVDEITDRGHALSREWRRPDSIVEILHPQAAHLLPLLMGTHWLLGLALIPQVDHPRVPFLLQLRQVLLRGLVAHRDRRGDRSLDVHGPSPRCSDQPRPRNTRRHPRPL